MSDSKNPEEILRKNEEDMSDIELMMASILSDKDFLGEKESEIQEDDFILEKKETYVSPVPPKRDRQPARTENRKGHEKTDFDMSGFDEFFSEKEKKHAPESRPDTLEPVKAKRSSKAAASSVKKTNSEREQKIAKQVKKKKKKPALLIITLILCALLIGGAIAFSSMMKDLFGGRSNPENLVYETEATQEEQQAYYVEIPDDTVFPAPETEESLAKLAEEELSGIPETQNDIVIMSSEPSGEKKYSIFVEDVSWTEARDRCISTGGKLVTIENQEQLDQVIALAEQSGIDKVWVGCHRENGELVWENGAKVDFYVWGQGEPSVYDSGDNVSEDYLLLWYFRGAWVYNDSRNDPVADYPGMYSGQIAYVCETY